MKETTANATREQGSAAGDSVFGAAEETLRLIASLPAPEGLADRVRAGLRAEPRKARVLRWPGALPGSGLAGNWMRGAAAAAIVLVVAGGGWGIYARVQTGQSDKVIALPARGGGFSSAGAMRTPDTLNGPMLTHPAKAGTDAAKKPVESAKKPVRHRVAATKKAAAQ